MKNVFTCPHCKAVLNPNVKILLVVGYRKKKGMILLSPQPLEITSTSAIPRSRNSWPRQPNSSSPAPCAPKPDFRQNSQFVTLQMAAPGREPRRVEFSRIYGKHATFIFDEEDVVAFGDDADDLGLGNFFGN